MTCDIFPKPFSFVHVQLQSEERWCYFWDTNPYYFTSSSQSFSVHTVLMFIMFKLELIHYEPCFHCQCGLWHARNHGYWAYLDMQTLMSIFDALVSLDWWTALTIVNQDFVPLGLTVVSHDIVHWIQPVFNQDIDHQARPLSIKTLTTRLDHCRSRH